MATIVDVRQPEEFDTSHADGAVNIPLPDLMADKSAADSLDKEDEVVVYCNTGSRSATAQKILKAQGFGNVVNGINQSTVETKHLNQ